jgi:hypothetical protein
MFRESCPACRWLYALTAMSISFRGMAYQYTCLLGFPAVLPSINHMFEKVSFCSITETVQHVETQCLTNSSMWQGSSAYPRSHTDALLLFLAPSVSSPSRPSSSTVTGRCRERVGHIRTRDPPERDDPINPGRVGINPPHLLSLSATKSLLNNPVPCKSDHG